MLVKGDKGGLFIHIRQGCFTVSDVTVSGYE